MYLMFEQGRRGGFSGVLGLRKVIANNRCISDYAKEKLSNFVLYLDANNLYGLAMSQKLQKEILNGNTMKILIINQIKQEHIVPIKND